MATNEHNFRVGERVRCINSEADEHLREGEICTVHGTSEKKIQIKKDGYWYGAFRFEHANQMYTWRSPEVTPENDDTVIVIVGEACAFSGAYNEAKEQVECLYDGLRQYTSWEDVQRWMPTPGSENDLGNQIEHVFGGEWVDHGDDVYWNERWCIERESRSVSLSYKFNDFGAAKVTIYQACSEDDEVRGALEKIKEKLFHTMSKMREVAGPENEIVHEGRHLHRIAKDVRLDGERNDTSMMIETRFQDRWMIETRFHDRWSEVAPNLLGYLLGSNNEKAPVSPEEAEVAATVIQWLGTPVGRHFLDTCGFSFVGFPEERNDR